VSFCWVRCGLGPLWIFVFLAAMAGVVVYALLGLLFCWRVLGLAIGFRFGTVGLMCYDAFGRIFWRVGKRVGLYRSGCSREFCGQGRCVRIRGMERALWDMGVGLGCSRGVGVRSLSGRCGLGCWAVRFWVAEDLTRGRVAQRGRGGIRVVVARHDSGR